ncbi:MAG: endonuclease/exonuclease/phosphatase family protein [Prevotella sp.]|nr:endonuclease/exonuclease/phosphatase family protein [Prevotella sp.]
MYKTIKKFTFRLIVAGNIIAILMMFLVGNVDRLQPAEYPLLANLGLGFPVLLALNLGFLVFWVLVRVRMIWLPVLGFLLCYGPVRTYTPFNLPEEKPHGALKVLSFNVFMFAPWDLAEGEPNPIVEYIVKSKADIVCLQEASAIEADSARVYSELRKHYRHFSLMVKKRPGDDHLILLSRYPILWQDSIPYGSSSNLSMAYMLDIRGTKTLVVNNHFESNGLNQDDKDKFKTLVKGDMQTGEAKSESSHLLRKLGSVSARRAPQAETVARYVRKYLDRKVPVILCGDFNDNPLSYVHRTMAKELTDCYVASGNGPGVSYHKSGMYFRIDHIFSSDDFEPFGATVDDKVTTSDHYPVYCWLKYRPKP